MKNFKLFSTMAAVISLILFASSSSYSSADDSLCQKKDGYFVYPPDPTKYIQCNDGVAVIKDCPEGLVWVPERMGCDFPEDGFAVQRNKQAKNVRCTKKGNISISGGVSFENGYRDKCKDGFSICKETICQ